MPRIEKSVFISYRRTNVPWALNVYQDLTHHGYDVFFDFEGIGSGDFESIIVDNITSRAHFLILLTPSALERCGDPRDWLRREIEVAIRSKRNIIPLMLEGFSFGTPALAAQLTGTLAPLKAYNGLSMPAEFFFAAMEKLRTKFLNIAVSTALQPAGIMAKEAANEQKVLADAAPPAQEEELTAQQYFERAFASTDLDEKIRFYTEAIRLENRFSEAYNNRANALRVKGKFEAALVDYDRAITLEPHYADAYTNRATLRSCMEDVGAAFGDHNEAVRLEPDNAKAYYNRAVSLQVSGELDAALIDFGHAIRLKPDYADAHHNRGMLRKAKGDLHGALADYDEAIRHNPDRAVTYCNRASARWAKGELDAALADYNRAIWAEPQYAPAYHNRGILLRGVAQPAAALADFERYLVLRGEERDDYTLKVEQWIQDLQRQQTDGSPSNFTPPRTPPTPP